MRLTVVVEPVQLSRQPFESTSPRAPCQRVSWGGMETSRSAGRDAHHGRWVSLREGRRWGVERFELDAGSGEDDVAGEVDGVLFAGLQVVDLVRVVDQRGVVSGVCCAGDQRPGLIERAGGEDGGVKATSRVRTAPAPGAGRSSRAVAMRKAGDAPVKAWAETLPSVACSPVGSVRTQVTPSSAAPRTCQAPAWSSSRRGRPRSSRVRSTEPTWSPEGEVIWET